MASGDSMLDETVPKWTQTSQGKSEETYVPLCISEGSCEASGVQSQHPTIETESNQMTPQSPFLLNTIIKLYTLLAPLKRLQRFNSCKDLGGKSYSDHSILNLITCLDTEWIVQIQGRV